MQALVRVAVISLLASAVHASAESRVCIGGDLDHMTAQQTSDCWASAHRVGAEATKFHAPANWHYYVLCTDADWKTYAAFSKHTAAQLALVGAETDLQSRTTFFRGEWLPKGDSFGLKKAVAHEVASAILHTTDEAVLQKQVAAWLPAEDAQNLPLQASR